MEYRLHPFADNGILIDLGKSIKETTLNKIQTISAFLDVRAYPWMIEYIPAFTTITIFYNPVKVLETYKSKLLPYEIVSNQLNSLISELVSSGSIQQRIINIPVCYDNRLGPDLKFVADYHQLTTDEVIKIHSSGEYLVYMIGFAPGFPYIGGMSKKISTPRKSSPSLKIPSGAVGIAGDQTGVYPIETPGGWQIIGQTPVKLFRPNDKTPSLLKAGDKVTFTPISYKKFLEWKEEP